MSQEKENEVELKHRVPRSEAAKEISKLENFSPHIVEATLRNTNWESVMRDFFLTNSPRFKDFRKTLREGGDFDVQMMSVFNDFMQAVESVIRNQVQIIGITEEQFVTATCEGIEKESPVSLQLVALLENHSNFYDFGRMMEDMYIKEYNIVRTEIGKPAELNHCRVLWDIENIGVPKKLSGVATVECIQRFLKTKGLCGSGVDCRISAFFDPARKLNSLSKKVVNELDKAAVEIVWVSSKKEDADRKLGNRISQEIQVLDPQNTTFVIITSDQDFRHHFQMLRSMRFTVIVIHNAPESSKWSTAMAMHCSESYNWDEVLSTGGLLGIDGNDSSDQMTKGNCSNEIPLPEGWERRYDYNSKKIFFVNHNRKITQLADPRVTCSQKQSRKKKSSIKKDDNEISLEGSLDFNCELESIWFLGKCKKWKNTYGFAEVLEVKEWPQSPQFNASGGGEDSSVNRPLLEKCAADLVGRDIFIHVSHLPDGYTKLNERSNIELQIGYTSKGLQATKTRPSSSSISPPEIIQNDFRDNLLDNGVEQASTTRPSSSSNSPS